MRRHHICAHRGSRPKAVGDIIKFFVLRKFVIKCLKKIGCFGCLVCSHGSWIVTTCIPSHAMLSHKKLLSNEMIVQY